MALVLGCLAEPRRTTLAGGDAAPAESATVPTTVASPAAPERRAPAARRTGAQQVPDDPVDPDAVVRHPPVRLEEPVRGAAALRAVEDRIEQVASFNGRSVAQLRRLLSTDETVWLDPGGRLFVREPARQAAADPDTAEPDTADQDAPQPDAAEPATSGEVSAGAAAATAVDPARAFQLHSLPGASRRIYLDFDGQEVSQTAWNLHTTSLLPAGWYQGWDPAGDGQGVFNDAERRAIYEIWARVAEDYAPFNVDVTTEDPGEAALARTTSADQTYGTRVVFSDSRTAMTTLCGGYCGGIAWIGVMGLVDPVDLYRVAWVFPAGTGQTPGAMAEGASHEAGHTLGLNHDGNASASYDQGHVPWAPIMGAAYYRGVSQWSKGDYTGATNREDDVAIIKQHLGERPDEAGGTVATAAALPVEPGIIASRADRDVYRLGECGAGWTVTAWPAALAGADLDVQLRIVDETGATLAAGAPATGESTVTITDPTGTRRSQRVGTGMDATLTGTAPGRLFVVVDGGGAQAGGAGNPVTDYDDYGSLGGYRVAAQGCSAATETRPAGTPEQTATPAPDPLVLPPAAPVGPTLTAPSRPRIRQAVPGRRGGPRTVIARWAPPASTGGRALTGYQLVVYRLRDGRVVGTQRLAVAPSRTSLELRLALRPRIRYAFAVLARNEIGWSLASGRSNTVRPR